jgi:hypothetical protein
MVKLHPCLQGACVIPQNDLRSRPYSSTSLNALQVPSAGMPVIKTVCTQVTTRLTGSYVIPQKDLRCRSYCPTTLSALQVRSAGGPVIMKVCTQVSHRLTGCLSFTWLEIFASMMSDSSTQEPLIATNIAAGRALVMYK